MEEFTITLPFKARANTTGDYFGYVDDFNGAKVDVAGHGTVSKLKKAFRARIAEKIAAGLLAAENTAKAFIGCKDGTVLLVCYEYCSWGYRIAGPDRNWAGGTWAIGTFKEALEYAEKHAEQAYGGVAWKV